MKLSIREYPVSSIEFGERIVYNKGRLTVNRNDIIAHLADSGDLDDFEIKEMELVSPATSTRVINVYEVMPAHVRLGENAVNFPGILGGIQTVGDGTSAALTNFSLLMISGRPGRFNKVLDKSGIGANISLYGGHFHIAITVVPKQADMTSADYYKGMKKIGLRIGSFLAKNVSEAIPEKTMEYCLEPRPQGLPKVAYVFMVASNQIAEKGEAVLYGDDLLGVFPTIVHPNEILDGAAIAPNFNVGIDTYTYLNNPVIKELYKKHGTEIDFAGVVVCVAHVTPEKRERSIQIAANLVSNILKADLAIVTKMGGGIPESDLMMTVEKLERVGVGTCTIIWAHWGDGSIQDILSAFSPAAKTAVSVGINDQPVNFPEQSRVIGGTMAGPFTDDPKDTPKPANLVIRPRYRDICGAVNQVGAGRVVLKEI